MVDSIRKAKAKPNTTVCERMIENVFLNLWNEANTFHCGANLLQAILSNKKIPAGDRSYIIAEAIMRWLGSSVGGSFIIRVKSSRLTDKTVAFQTAWKDENTPKPWINDGHTAIELIMSGHEGSFSSVTDQDKEVAKAIIQWLGTSMGQGLLTEAERRIKYLRKVTGYALDSKFCPNSSYLSI